MTQIEPELEEIRDLLYRFNIKRRELAEEAGHAPQVISAWLGGKKICSSSTRVKLLLATKRLVRSKLVSKQLEYEEALSEVAVTLGQLQDEEEKAFSSDLSVT